MGLIDLLFRKAVVRVFAEELVVIDTDSALWEAVRPLVAAALRLDQQQEASWHGWNKEQITTFLRTLPEHCTLVCGVWDTLTDEEGDEREVLVLGCVCEVQRGEVLTVRTFEALQDEKLPPLQELEPGFEHAREIMRTIKAQIAPVAWALFTDKTTWDEWLLAEGNEGGVADKKTLLSLFAQQGRCVLMGSQAAHHSHHP